MLSIKVVLVCAVQLSVAVTVIVKFPTGPALVTVTAPVATLVVSVPVKPGEETAVRLTTVPLSVGAAL
ncbi:MAG: hypothetical protein M3X11_25660, partial [Acidobacteriota bacterium]|nr:hypothetical protein [Acidobacteriota bacterium]